MPAKLLDTSGRLLNVLVLQGGGALGAYQAGAYEELAKEGFLPDYVAGISIGAINAALIAGNRPEHRVERLRAFWDMASNSSRLARFYLALLQPFMPRGSMNDLWANHVMFTGVPGFFRPRMPPPVFYRPGSPEARSFYDTSPLRETLLELVDFDFLNNSGLHFAVGAVNVETGNMTYFDNSEHVIGPEHIMASGALPPGFPPVEIDGNFYWDGGVVSNTPLNYFLEHHDSSKDALVFQFDLFNARGALPKTVFEIEAREKDIRFSSRTRFATDTIRDFLELRATILRLYDKMPEDMKMSDDAQAILKASHQGRITIVQMIYRAAAYERASKDYEFSRASMSDHWAAGAKDARHTFGHADWIRARAQQEPITVIDCGRPPRKDKTRSSNGENA